MKARHGLGAALAGVAVVSLGLWLAQGAGNASARSSETAIPPKEEALAPVQAAPPEGIEVAEATVEPTGEPVQRAASEQAAAVAPAPEPAPEEAAPPSAESGGLLKIDSDQPLSIKADELEAIELPDGRRQLVFSRSVNVEQGALLVRSQRLEAHYAANASQPERLVASGNVRVRQKTRELSCNKATYFPAAERLECVGNAQLQDGNNRVTGERIDILFGEDRIRVKGGAVVNVAPDRSRSGAGATP